MESVRVKAARGRVEVAASSVAEARSYFHSAVSNPDGITTAAGYDSVAAAATTVAAAIRQLGFYRADLARIEAVEAGAPA